MMAIFFMVLSASSASVFVSAGPLGDTQSEVDRHASNVIF